MPPPKKSFRIQLPNGSNLSVAIFATRNNPETEVISVRISRLVDETWETEAKLAIYRSPEGNYSQLPERDKAS